MISASTRAVLDRYALASRALSRESGERIATEAGQSVEFHDFRAYQPGDELRYVDWRVYARTGRLYTRLFQAERTIELHVLLDTSASMRLGGKLAYARILAQLLAYVGQRDARCQVHLFGGAHSAMGQGRAGIGETWRFIEEADAADPDRDPGGALAPLEALKHFALTLPLHRGAALVLVISDLFDEGPFEPALAALKTRGLDASFLQVMAESDLRPEEGQLELLDVESSEKLYVGPAEVRAYRQAVQGFLERTRSAALRAGYRHLLLRAVPPGADGIERDAFAALVREGILVKR